MKSVSKMIGATLAAALCAGLLAGCGPSMLANSTSSGSESTPASSSGTSSSASSGAAGTPDIDYSKGLLDNGHLDGVKALDYVTLPKDYKAIPLKEEDVAVKDEDLQTQIDSILAQFAKKEQLKDRAVKDGDAVNIDYVGSVGGVEFEGGTTNGAGTLVTIGVTQYIDDFLEQLIGHKPGETFDINVTFPEDYGKDDLNGKDAVFKTTVNYIEGNSITPSLTDDFVKENLSESNGWTTVAAMRDEISASMRSDNIYNAIWDHMMDGATISEVPQAALDFQTDGMRNQYKMYAASYGMAYEDFIKQALGVESEEKLLENMGENLSLLAKQSLVIQAVAEDAGIEVTESDIKDYFKTNSGSEDTTQYVEQFGKPFVAYAVLSELVNAFLADNITGI